MRNRPLGSLSTPSYAVDATRWPLPRLLVMEGTTRDRIVAAAVEMTTTTGWATVTMARLAQAVGVSRQTVYNEVGTKSALAETMVFAELARFLAVVEAAFDHEPDDLSRAIGRAVNDVLTYAQDNNLLHAVVSATHGADTELLPLLTTHADSLLVVAKGVIAERIAPYDLDLGPARLDAAAEKDYLTPWEAETAKMRFLKRFEELKP